MKRFAPPLEFRFGPWALGVLALGLALSACRPAAIAPEATPYETLLLLQSDFMRYAQLDLYRHAPPLDLSGQNGYRATLARLEAYEQSNPGVDSDVVHFVRAQALARLGDFRQAVEIFEALSAQSDSPLASRAAERGERLGRIERAKRRPENLGRLEEHFADMEARRERLGELETLYAGSYDAILARCELEQADVEYALALFRNRFVIERGAARAIEFATAMLDRHAQSRRVQAHRLMLGRFHLELARDLETLRPPERLGFDSELFHSLAGSARQQFTIVSRADGYDEKLEAAAELRALDALVARVRKLEQ